MSLALDDEPSIILHGVDGVRRAVEREAREEWRHCGREFAFRIKSDWLVSLIAEMVANARCQIASNADVKMQAEAILGFPTRSHAYYAATEGDTLSLLIYNAQGFFRQAVDRAKDEAETADGWIRPTVDWLAEHVGEQVAVLRVDKPARVELHNNKPILRPYRKRTLIYSLEGIKVRPLTDGKE